MVFNEKYMLRCLQLAAKGRGRVAPNPMVGSVIVWNDSIIGEGYHRTYGESHAEVNAIASVKDVDLLKDSTLYVNLEPCSHYGKTPPCADLIINKGIPRVVIGIQDPFPKVAGGGIKRLIDAGIEVVVGVLEDACRELNKRFLVFHANHRPYIILKWAQSSDGFIDKLREVGDKQTPVKFSDDFTQILVHKLRAEENAIIVGKNTERLDSPLLTTRYWDGKNPVKIELDNNKTLSELMGEMYDLGWQSLIVEGGSRLLSSFIKEGLWDEARIEIADFLLKDGVKAPAINGIIEDVQKYKNSVLLHYRNEIKPKNI
ncbi:bifunctional diaminohydroxyphosphoribosylaminopyrimidine deaminase/5-amino-6-(5-phosphoribosylamino)uracil reductase RibD [Bacteroidales bacterium OttesenSCG-928-M11]|nr:bifunctional diaminohydroxyphosphoribosylaminopyrimidine deaminase/5-amino-6-(5-phosphoribosylamino)uracil reductase RibD [Bacteroidales bacterium OttesenSCG-928-M11]